ncbi:hyaluronidase [Streptomyces sp. Ru73]|uniref:beta-N-acetylglucosaminidase domain-containing protein n=1 Tax=Streptomyces sp. Ru73 TaxID=2080748 RepID=UPI000CDE26AA|nr:beta-N-acetylglucosaminidase domain-containing protein [Streptomyces sp. Ru73]POX38387.1 hyaluronidase [Streptomyces sp. Ru73]
MAGTTALAAAVIGGLLGGVPAAQAAPDEPATGAPDRPADAAPTPAVWPRPQSLRTLGTAVPLGTAVTVVSPEDTDPYAVEALLKLLRSAGVRTVHEARPGAPLPSDGPLIRVGGQHAADALRALHAPARGTDLPSGGYRLAVGEVAGRGTVAMEGAGPDGLFHAVQTLRQLITRDADGGHRLASVAVRDWPGTAVRGTTEGFFGRPWSQAERLAQLDFMGRTKQNRFLYAAGDDPYRQARWRDPYPAAQRADFRELAERARANHVTLGWAVSPGQSMCLSSAEDVRALQRKVDAMWALGVRGFQLQFQDVSYSEWHCDADGDAFGTGPEAAARAQAKVANALADHLAERHPGAAPLSLMPTEYYQDGSTAYREALADALADRVEVAWTGVGVVPRTITGGELARAREVFGHRLITMDNYPVNDYAQDRIFLGPYTGREPAVATGSAALLANAMEQPTASRIPLFTAADYAWNPRDYRPKESWRAAIDDLADGLADDGGSPAGGRAGGDRTRAALHALAGNAASSVLHSGESGYLRPLIDRFWAARATAVNGGGAAADEAYTKAAAALRSAFTTMSEAPDRLTGGLADEVRPWSEQLARYGRAGVRAVDMLRAQARGDGAAAWRAQRAAERLRKEIGVHPATVGKGVLGPFLDRALRESDAWTGAASDAPAPHEAAHATALTVPFGRVRTLSAVTALTDPSRDAARATVEARVPGQGWRRLGRLAASGWTQTAAHGMRADAVRLHWDEDDPAPSVSSLTPWFDDTAPAGLELSRKEVDADTGGTAAVDVRLFSRRPSDVRGRLRVEAPRGFAVQAPDRLTAPRGGTATARLRITVPAGARTGTYEVPVSFGDEKRTLTLRTFPPTGGRDLARGARATSSGDETEDFPASAATDGDPRTRWSSPAEDGAWLQFALDRPVRLGRVVLHWQDAYAARYRVQVSSDGRTWRTAATVRDGGGGRESVRMDAKDVRYVRIQGDERATRFGYSLWGVEAYAVSGRGHADDGGRRGDGRHRDVPAQRGDGAGKRGNEHGHPEDHGHRNGHGHAPRD